MTVQDALQGINAYPIPLRTLTETAERRGIALDAEATQDTLLGSVYRLCSADVMRWLSFAPNISQGGQSYSFTDNQRDDFRRRANAIYAELGETESIFGTTYGYKGSRL